MIRIKVMVIILFLSLIIPVFASEESEAKFNSAMSLYEAGEIQKAIEKTKKAVSLDPKVPHYYSFLGLSYLYLDNMEEANAQYLKLKKINTEKASVLEKEIEKKKN